MWIGRISSAELNSAGRWTVAFFSAETVSQDSQYPMCILRTLVDESKEAIDPQSLSDAAINYIGLENVRSHTGEIVDFDKKSPKEVKSRSKTFKEGDVLFGRLRPELNKVYLAEASVAPGICSNEFIILRAKADRIRPRYLRYILASPYVTQFASKLRTGASLPRINSADLLDLVVPVPPVDIQDRMVEGLHRLDHELRDLRRRIESLPNAIVEGLMTSLARGTNELEMIESGYDKSRNSSR